jgi:hypothetical protein
MERVGDDIARELARFGAATGLTPLVEAWPAAVGPEIARNAWPARLARDGTLHVHTSSAAWAFELRQLEARIRASLGELAPPCLRFAVGPLPEPGSEEMNEGAARRVKPSAQHAAAAAELTAQMGDEKLRKVVAKAAALSLAQADADRMFW